MVRACVIASDEARAVHLQRKLRRPGLLEILYAFDFTTPFIETTDCEQVDLIVIDASTDESTAISTSVEISRTNCTPIVMLAAEHRISLFSETIANTSGVLGVLHFPEDNTDEQEQAVRHLLLFSEIKVVRRWDLQKYETLSQTQTANSLSPVPVLSNIGIEEETKIPHVIVLGASAGGTKALQEIISHLPPDFPVPLLVVQHLTKGYVHGFAQWLQTHTKIRVMVAEEQQPLQAKSLYIAPDDRHLTISRDNTIALLDSNPVNGFRPSIGLLFTSALTVFGSRTLAVLLSGMGHDGAHEMRALSEVGAMTLVQDKESSLIHGIPGEAIKLGAARRILPVHQIAPVLMTLCMQRPLSGHTQQL